MKWLVTLTIYTAVRLNLVKGFTLRTIIRFKVFLLKQHLQTRSLSNLLIIKQDLSGSGYRKLQFIRRFKSYQSSYIYQHCSFSLLRSQ